MKKAKEVFRDTDVYLNFSYLGRDYGTFAYTPDAYYIIHKIKGRVLASLYMHENYPEPILSFYVVRSTDVYTDDMREEFERKYLFEFRRLYFEMKNIKQTTGKCKMMLVELLNGKLKLHETTL